MPRDDIFVARTTFHFLDENGFPQIVRRGSTVRAGHPIMDGREDDFRPLTVDYEVKRPVGRPPTRR